MHYFPGLVVAFRYVDGCTAVIVLFNYSNLNMGITFLSDSVTVDLGHYSQNDLIN